MGSVVVVEPQGALERAFDLHDVGEVPAAELDAPVFMQEGALHSLDEARAFDRVYDDLLSDPEFTEAIEPFFGSIGIDRSYAVSTLRFVAPPDQ